MDVIKKTQEYTLSGLISKKAELLFLQFYTEYKNALEKNGVNFSPYIPIFMQFLEEIRNQISSPFLFLPYHTQIREPFYYYKFGLDLIRPLIDLKNSSLDGTQTLEEIIKKLQNKENVIFLANHQIEADPQVLSILLGDKYSDLAQKLIFVAGERVITDPLAVPFSK